MPLGILERVNFQDHTITIDPGDVLLFYTDGVTDAFVSNEVFGEERLINTIKESTSPSSRNLLAKLDQALIKFSGSEIPFDDVTVLALSRNLPE